MLPFYYIGRGEAYIRTRQPEAALNDFSKALEINPNYIDSHYHRASAYYQIGDYENAITEVDLYLRHIPRDSKALTLRDRAHKKKRNPD